MATKCPVCGSADVQSEKVEESLPVPYGPAATFTTTQYICNTCGESGDFIGENTAIINEALKKSISVSVSAILDHLAKEGVSAAYFERAMRLPSRTTARWKTGELSASAIALLRSVCTYPWLLEVADANFEQSMAKRKVINVAADLVASVFQGKVSEGKVGIAVTSTQVNVAAQFQLTGQPETSIIGTESSEQLARIEPVALLSST